MKHHEREGSKIISWLQGLALVSSSLLVGLIFAIKVFGPNLAFTRIGEWLSFLSGVVLFSLLGGLPISILILSIFKVIYGDPEHIYLLAWGDGTLDAPEVEKETEKFDATLRKSDKVTPRP